MYLSLIPTSLFASRRDLPSPAVALYAPVMSLASIPDRSMTPENSCVLGEPDAVAGTPTPFDVRVLLSPPESAMR